MLEIYVDADACPVKDEVYRVAERYRLTVHVVSNGGVRVPESPLIRRVIVPSGLDIADDWIAERAGPGDIVVTGDIPLAARVLTSGARAISNSGTPFTEASIGQVKATRDLMTSLRETGVIGVGGNRSFAKQDRSRFLSALDNLVHAVKRDGR
jgi:uncharacterized protein YaiI (UPF0178 family)